MAVPATVITDIIGIDLGTTYSAAAIVGERGPVLVANAEGRITTPSAVYVEEAGGLTVGEDALAAAAADRANAFLCFKRGMGTDARYRARGRVWTPVDLSAAILGKLRRDASRRLDRDIVDAVVTIPAYFDEHARLATREAAEAAGLRVRSLLHEPTAAALSLGLQASGGEERTVLVYDLGGGTFDVSIVVMSAESMEVVATVGDHRLGGADWDSVLLSLVAQRFAARHGIDPRHDGEASGVLALACEEAKRRFAARTEVAVRCVVDEVEDSITVTRDEFEDATRHLLARTEDIVLAALEDARLRPDQIDAGVLVGGSTRLRGCPGVLKRCLGTEPLQTLNPDEAVATGAALRAAMLDTAPSPSTRGPVAAAEPLQMRELHDVTAHALGFVTVDATGAAYVNDVMIPRQTRLPARVGRPKQFDPRRAGDDLVVYLLQGDATRPVETTPLGRYTFEALSALLPDGGEVEILFGYDPNGMVTIDVEVGGGRVSAPAVDRSDIDLSWTDLPPGRGGAGEVAAMLVLDCSPSMSLAMRQRAVAAGQEFLAAIGAGAVVGLIGFGGVHQTLSPATDDLGEVGRCLTEVLGLSIDGTMLHGALLSSLEALREHPGRRRLAVVLTDGEVFDAADCLSLRNAYLAEEIDVVVIGVAAAQPAFVAAMGTVDSRSILTDLESLGAVFRGIAQDIADGRIGLLGSEPPEPTVHQRGRHDGA